MGPADDVRAVLEKLGLDTSHLGEVKPVQARHGNRLFRITLQGSSYILKLFGNPDASREVQAYALLTELGVPTLRTIATADDALLLEDLEVSENLRLAIEDDVAEPEVGVAVATWYRALHQAGSRLSPGQADASLLWREIDELTAGSILNVASKIRVSDHPKWVILADNIDRIKSTAVASDETLTGC